MGSDSPGITGVEGTTTLRHHAALAATDYTRFALRCIQYFGMASELARLVTDIWQRLSYTGQGTV